MGIHLVIHGHFYQPPRENPWTGQIERQESAAPFHDWNTRITEQCYRPNASSRVLDEHGRIQDIVNNFERMSFNVGPTLFAWLAEAAPDVVAALRAGDRCSRSRLGHGNAIAQAYNHMILPLATRRDRWTQIRWGLFEFQHRFGRPAEALWLPETAVDRLTLELLVEAGMRYLILSPAQAARWRPMGEGRWTTAAEAELDPRRPYRWLLRDRAGRPQGDRGLDLCFYHSPLSRGISFQHYLRDAGLLADQITEAGQGCHEPLILIATDGESFGHHERFGDMCLATLSQREAPRRDFASTNLAAYLETHRPTWEVELQPESAWSCSHGVARWTRDCGCSTGGGPGWNQRWREPLRRGLDRLRDALATIYQEDAAALLREPWAARDAYVELLLDRSDAAREAFFSRHQTHPLTAEEQAMALRLLEMQHQAMRMYTSCGWFFADLSGIETVQNLRYAWRAIELAAPFAPVDLEAILLEELGRARSNQEAHKDGRHIWEHAVRPARAGAEEAVARLLLEGLLGRDLAPQVRYRWSLMPERHAAEEGLVLAGVRAVSEVTHEERRLIGAGRRHGPFGFLAGVAPWPTVNGWEGLVSEARIGFDPEGRGLDAWAGRRAARLLRLTDFLPDERQAILHELLTDTEAAQNRAVDALCAEALPAAEAMLEVGMGLPPWLQAVLEAGWSRRLVQHLETLEGVTDPARYAEAVDLAVQARHLGLRLDLAPASAHVAATLARRLDDLASRQEVGDWQDFLALLQVGTRLGLDLEERGLQDRMFVLLRTQAAALAERLRDVRETPYSLVSAMLAVAERLNLCTEAIRRQLKPLETPLATDPAYWP
jgi:alpha-amylase/alpha-mannosidase (GH57 family)